VLEVKHFPCLNARFSVLFPVLFLANLVTIVDLLALGTVLGDTIFAAFSALGFQMARILENQMFEWGKSLYSERPNTGYIHLKTGFVCVRFSNGRHLVLAIKKTRPKIEVSALLNRFTHKKYFFVLKSV
jgi:hypothetical protein